MNHPIYKMQQDFLRRHEHAMADELSKMLEGEELLSMQERTAVAATLRFDNNGEHQAWLPDGYHQIFRSHVFGPSGFWTMAPLRYAAKFDPFLSLDCAPTPSTLAQSKERKGSNFAA